MKPILTAAMICIAAVSFNKLFTYDPMAGALLYIGDKDENEGTCTIFLPSYTKMDKTIPVIPVRNVRFTEYQNQTSYSCPGFSIRIDGKVYHFIGASSITDNE